MRYALINPQNAIDRMASDVDPNVKTKPGWRWLAAPPEARPAYDPATQVCEGPVHTVNADSVAESYSVRSKTAAELDADKTSQASGVDKVLAAAVFDLINEVRALKTPPQSALTKAQFVTYLKSKVGTF